MINVALCAWGMSGREFHAPLIAAEPGLRLHSILRRSGPDGSEPPGVRIVGDFEAMLADPTVDLVVVNTPNRLHYPMARAALDAGRHVVLEKPMTVDLDEARALIEQARRLDRRLFVFHNRRLDAEHLTLARHLAAGDLGRLIEVEWHYDRHRPEITHKRWKEDDLPGAGTWFDLGSHLVDSMRSLFGTPRSVAADMDSLRRPGGATDYFDVRFRYPDHRVILRSSPFVRELGPVLVAHGERGSMVIAERAHGVDVPPFRPSGEASPARLSGRRALIHTLRDGRVVREAVPLEPSRHRDFYRDVVVTVEGRRPSAFGPEDAMETLRLIHIASEVAEMPGLGCGSDLAPDLVRRPYRLISYIEDH